MISFLKKRALKKRIEKLDATILNNIVSIESIFKEKIFFNRDIDDIKLRAIAVAGVLHACTEMRQLYANDELIGKSLFYSCMRFAPVEYTDLIIDLAEELNHTKKNINENFWPCYSSKTDDQGDLAIVYMALIDIAPIVGSNIINNY